MGSELENKALAEKIINKAIQEVVFKYIAYAPIISSFRIAYTDIVPTMGVDKYARLVVNPEFAVKNELYMQGIIIHEALHIFLGHTSDTRTKLAFKDNDERHNKIANIAEDCAINQLIAESLPDYAVSPNTLSMQLNIDVPRHLSAEEYYDIINKQLEKDDTEESSSLSLSLSNGTCATDEVASQRVQDELDRMGVEHISQEEINERVMDAAKEMVKGRSSDYGSLVAFAKEMLEPQVDWRPLLQAAARNAEKKVWTIHSKQTFKRVSRRSGQVLMPKRYGHKVSVTLSFDTSGSISHEMVSQFLSEIQNCMRYSEIKECALWHTSVYWFGSPDQLEKDIEKVFEQGGTSSRCVEVCAEHTKADIHFAFTDGDWGADPVRTENCKVGELYSIRWDGKTIKEIRKEF